MVKLFVGNLDDRVDETSLRQLFSQYADVLECDVLKNFAFVHVANEESVREVIDRLDGYVLEGRPIHIEQSKSQLRKRPGMGDVCFRCGRGDHKTANCPDDPKNRYRGSTTTNISLRIGEDGSLAPAAKRSAADGITPLMSVNPQRLVSERDPELPRPMDIDLVPLYEQYLESRQRYYYFKDRLSKEISIRSGIPVVAAPAAAPLTAAPVPMMSTTAPGGYYASASASAAPSAPAIQQIYTAQPPGAPAVHAQPAAAYTALPTTITTDIYGRTTIGVAGPGGIHPATSAVPQPANTAQPPPQAPYAQITQQTAAPAAVAGHPYALMQQQQAQAASLRAPYSANGAAPSTANPGMAPYQMSAHQAAPYAPYSATAAAGIPPGGNMSTLLNQSWMKRE